MPRLLTADERQSLRQHAARMEQVEKDQSGLVEVGWAWYEKSRGIVAWGFRNLDSSRRSVILFEELVLFRRCVLVYLQLQQVLQVILPLRRNLTTAPLRAVRPAERPSPRARAVRRLPADARLFRLHALARAGVGDAGRGLQPVLAPNRAGGLRRYAPLGRRLLHRL